MAWSTEFDSLQFSLRRTVISSNSRLRILKELEGNLRLNNQLKQSVYSSRIRFRVRLIQTVDSIDCRLRGFSFRCCSCLHTSSSRFISVPGRNRPRPPRLRVSVLESAAFGIQIVFFLFPGGLGFKLLHVFCLCPLVLWVCPKLRAAQVQFVFSIDAFVSISVGARNV